MSDDIAHLYRGKGRMHCIGLSLVPLLQGTVLDQKYLSGTVFRAKLVLFALV